MNVTRVPVTTNHTFHLVMTIVTCGMWAPIWLAVWAINSTRTRPIYGPGPQTIIVPLQQWPPQTPPPPPPPYRQP